MRSAYIDPTTGITVVGTGTYLLLVLLSFLGIFSLFLKKVFRFIWKNKIVFLIILIILILAISITAKVMMNQAASSFHDRIIILGFDGLSPDIIEPLMEKGELPHFSRLREGHSYRRLATTNPPQSPVAWTGFATGRNPGKTGVFDFIIRDPSDYGLKLSLSTMEKGKFKRVIQGKCLWNYSTERNVPATFISCPVTFPPDRINGRMLSGMGTPDILGTEGTFTFYTTEKSAVGQDVGGKVFHVNKSPSMVMHLIGPRVANIKGKAENIRVPFKVIMTQGDERIGIEYQNNKFELEKGKWSDFKDVSFKVGTLRKARGILRFYLVETNPELKLYASPINFDPRDPFFEISYPKSYSKELASNLGLFSTMGMPMDTWALNENRLTEEPFLEQVNRIFNEKSAQLDFELKRFKEGILYCYFEPPDIIQHMFWRYTDPEHPIYERDAPPQYREAIINWYKEMDKVLGRVMEKTGESDTLIVLSDHGFNTFRRAVHINTWLRRNGFLQLKDPNAQWGAELLKDIDWSKTRAYAIGFGAIYINEKGRERDGIVTPGEEKESVKKEIVEGLNDWVDKKYETKVLHKVYSREEMFWGDFSNGTPDLYIGFNIGYRASWQTALGAVPDRLIEDNTKKWSGDHLFDPVLIPGVLFMNKKITKENPSILDITPTVLKIIGFTPSELKECDLDGSPLL